MFLQTNAFAYTFEDIQILLDCKNASSVGTHIIIHMPQLQLENVTLLSFLKIIRLLYCIGIAVLVLENNGLYISRCTNIVEIGYLIMEADKNELCITL